MRCCFWRLRLFFLTSRVLFAQLTHLWTLLSHIISHNYKGQLCADRRRSRAGRVEDSGGLGGRNRALRSRRRPGRQGVGRPKWSVLQNRTASPPGQGLFREPGAVARPGSERTAPARGPAWPCWPPPRCWPWPRPRRPRPRSGAPPSPPRTWALAPSAATTPRATPRLTAATPPSSPTTTSRSAPLTTPSGLSSWQPRVYKSLPPASSPTPTPSSSCWAPPLSLSPTALPDQAALAGSGLDRHLLDRRHRRQRQAHLPHRARRAHRAGRDRQRAVPDRPRLDRPGQHRRLRHHRLQDRGLPRRQ